MGPNSYRPNKPCPEVIRLSEKQLIEIGDQQGKSKIILQVHASFSDRQTVSALSQARLADEDASALPRAPPDPHSDGDTAITADDHDDGAEDVGLGKMRMALLKLGCRVNMEAPASVSRMLILR